MTINAIYKHGVFEPLEPVGGLTDNQPVQLQVWPALPNPSPDAETWNQRTPAERAAAWQAWVASLPQREGPPIPDEALRRENMYD